MFWDNYVKLCNSVGKAPSVVAEEIGIKSTGTVPGWKKGAVPRQSALVKLAEYFGVTVGYLLGYEQQKKPIAQDDGLTEDQVRAIEKIKNMPPDELARKMAALEAVLDM